MLKTILSILFLGLFSSTAGSIQTQSPDFVFTIVPEKQNYRPGEAIWVQALLRNQSAKDIYVPHSMSPCWGLSSRIDLSLAVVKGKLPDHGRGCGVGSGCGDCKALSFYEQVKTSWVLLHPGEIFGARIEIMTDAPEVPGTYSLQAAYLRDKQLGEQLGSEGNQINVIAGHYQARAVQITVSLH